MTNIKDILGDYFLKLSLLILGAWILQPLLKGTIPPRIVLVGGLLFFASFFSGAWLWKKHREEKRHG